MHLKSLLEKILRFEEISRKSNVGLEYLIVFDKRGICLI